MWELRGERRDDERRRGEERGKGRSSVYAVTIQKSEAQGTHSGTAPHHVTASCACTAQVLRLEVSPYTLCTYGYTPSLSRRSPLPAPVRRCQWQLRCVTGSTPAYDTDEVTRGAASTAAVLQPQCSVCSAAAAGQGLEG